MSSLHFASPLRLGGSRLALGDQIPQGRLCFVALCYTFCSLIMSTACSQQLLRPDLPLPIYCPATASSSSSSSSSSSHIPILQWRQSSSWCSRSEDPTLLSCTLDCSGHHAQHIIPMLIHAHMSAFVVPSAFVIPFAFLPGYPHMSGIFLIYILVRHYMQQWCTSKHCMHKSQTRYPGHSEHLIVNHA